MNGFEWQFISEQWKETNTQLKRLADILSYILDEMREENDKRR